MKHDAEFDYWLTELAEPFWLQDSMKQGEFFDVTGFAKALMAANKAVPVPKQKELRSLAESFGATPTEARDPDGKVVLQFRLRELQKFAEHFAAPMPIDAKHLTAEIKKVVREKPTALNAYGLKSWAKIERMIGVALVAAATGASK